MPRVESLSRTQRDLQRLDGRRGPPSARAVTWGDLDELLAQIAARSRASNGKFAEAAFGGGAINFDDIFGEIDVDQIVSPYLDAPTGLTITSTVNEETGVSFIYVDWDDFEGASGYHLGISLDNGGEFIVPAPSSFFQDSVIAGTLISVRVRALNSLNVPGAWSAYVNHIAQADTIPPPVPTGLKITPAFNGFWIEWDPSPAADISRYDIFESELPNPAPTAATNPSFTSASAVFFRGSLPNGATRYYWIRAVDYSENASAWTARITATTVVDPRELLDLLEGEITETQLFADLGARIDLIDDPVNGLVTRLSGATADVTLLKNTVNDPITGVAASASGVSALWVQTENLGNGIASVAGRATALEATVNHPITGVAVTASALDTLETTVYHLSSGLLATANKATNLQIKIDDPITGLASTYAAFQQEAQIRAEETGNLFGQYTVKIDLNGYVSGFGLASEAPIDGTPRSDFVVNADSFSVAGTGAEPEIPFIVRTSGTVIGGQYVPPGVYIRDGFIQNGTITNATIANATISDAKIASLSAAKLIAGTAIANSVVVNGQALGTIQQNADNPAARINSASTNILPGRITISGPATLLDWTASGDRTRIDGGRIFTNSISANAINTIELAADSAFITNLTSTGTSFMNQLIVRTANIQDLAVDTLRIKDNAVTIPVTSTGATLIGDGTFKLAAYIDFAIPYGGDVLFIWNFRQGYSTFPGPTWAFQLRYGVYGAIIDERLPMGATTDYPTGSYLLKNVGASNGQSFSLHWRGSSNQISAIGSLTALTVMK